MEVYPDAGKKIGKQFGYADNKGIPFVITIGEVEAQQDTIRVKELASGEQAEVAFLRLTSDA